MVLALSNTRSLNQIENLQKRELMFILQYFQSSCDNLLRLSISCAINVTFYIKIFVWKWIMLRITQT